MASEKLLQTLIEIGLNENEARVYHSALVVGPSSVSTIAKHAQVKRTTTYSIIESLISKSLVREEVRGFKKVFAAEHPDRLEAILEGRQRRLQESLPEFTALYNLKEGESSIKFYQGLESVKEVYEGILRDIGPNEDYLIVGDQRQWLSLDPDYFQGFVERRAALVDKLHFNVRLLLQDSTTAREYQRDQDRYREEIRILPKKTSLTTNLVIIPKRVVIHQLVPPIHAMVIENPNIVRMHTELFSIMWNELS